MVLAREKVKAKATKILKIIIILKDDSGVYFVYTI